MGLRFRIRETVEPFDWMKPGVPHQRCVGGGELTPRCVEPTPIEPDSAHERVQVASSSDRARLHRWDPTSGGELRRAAVVSNAHCRRPRLGRKDGSVDSWADAHIEAFQMSHPLNCVGEGSRLDPPRRR